MTNADKNKGSDFMDEQTVTITIEEYKKLRDVCEQYHQLVGQYNLLSLYYNDLVAQVTPTETKQKEKIGFKTKEKGGR